MGEGLAEGAAGQEAWCPDDMDAIGPIPGVNDPKGCWMPEEELRLARNLVESAGLRYITGPYIEDASQR